MFLRINQVRVSLDYSEEEILRAVNKKLRAQIDKLRIVRLIRRSIDARQRNDKPYFIFTLVVELIDTVRLPIRLKNHPDIEIEPENLPEEKSTPKADPSKKIVVVGMGPAGLMCALTLVKAGYKPLVIDRGGDVISRDSAVSKFWTDGTLDTENNVLYGEGGAGLFSDGKLTARTKDRGRVKQFFQTLVECGCDEDILIDAQPHVGSDVLKRVIANLRKKIIKAGGEIKFNTRLDDLVVEDGRITHLKIHGHDTPVDACFLAAGHSARDVYKMLHQRGAELSVKPFAVGVRLELPQDFINRAQYGKFAKHQMLPPASFRLTRKPTAGVRACYSFCTCPGGLVINCASSENEFTTNGMSLSARDLPFANSAFLVPVTPQDFAHAGPLAGIEFQQEIERKAFEIGGSDYSVPACTLHDFVKGEDFKEIFYSRSCQRAVAADIRPIFPEFVIHTLKHSISKMLLQMKGVNPNLGLLYAPETRSSAPVRIERDAETGQCNNIAGLYPAGEGAGHAGGIVSSAVDGIRQAELFIS